MTKIKDTVQLLLDNSGTIELNTRNNVGETALMLACHDGQKDIVQLFMGHSESDIDLNVRYNIGRTALMPKRTSRYRSNA